MNIYHKLDKIFRSVEKFDTSSPNRGS